LVTQHKSSEARRVKLNSLAIRFVFFMWIFRSGNGIRVGKTSQRTESEGSRAFCLATFKSPSESNKTPKIPRFKFTWHTFKSNECRRQEISISIFLARLQHKSWDENENFPPFSDSFLERARALLIIKSQWDSN
jgi:hypothetical protein